MPMIRARQRRRGGPGPPAARQAADREAREGLSDKPCKTAASGLVARPLTRLSRDAWLAQQLRALRGLRAENVVPSSVHHFCTVTVASTPASALRVERRGAFLARPSPPSSGGVT